MPPRAAFTDHDFAACDASLTERRRPRDAVPAGRRGALAAAGEVERRQRGLEGGGLQGCPARDDGGGDSSPTVLSAVAVLIGVLAD